VHNPPPIDGFRLEIRQTQHVTHSQGTIVLNNQTKNASQTRATGAGL
jgi:hypothetical protein